MTKLAFDRQGENMPSHPGTGNRSRLGKMLTLPGMIPSSYRFECLYSHQHLPFPGEENLLFLTPSYSSLIRQPLTAESKAAYSKV